MPDQDGPPSPDSGFFGLDADLSEADAVILGAPYEATVSFRTGTRDGPEAMRRASHQIDLFDLDVGDLGRHAIASEILYDWGARSDDVRPAARRVIAALENELDPDPADIALVDAAGAELCAELQKRCAAWHARGAFVAVVGGDHSIALGPLLAAKKAHPDMGVLHVDAHADLRVAYEGFVHSHASFLYEFLHRAGPVPTVSVGLRDLCAAEHRMLTEHDHLHPVFDRQLRHARAEGRVRALFDEAVGHLPPSVYVTFDIDGMSPTECPHTGTPVPGGMSFDEAVLLLEALHHSGRRIIGADLCEVAPGPEGPDSIDANVGARLLAKLVGFGLLTRDSGRAHKVAAAAGEKVSD